MLPLQNAASAAPALPAVPIPVPAAPIPAEFIPPVAAPPRPGSPPFAPTPPREPPIDALPAAVTVEVPPVASFPPAAAPVPPLESALVPPAAMAIVTPPDAVPVAPPLPVDVVPPDATVAAPPFWGSTDVVPPFAGEMAPPDPEPIPPVVLSVVPSCALWESVLPPQPMTSCNPITNHTPNCLAPDRLPCDMAQEFCQVRQHTATWSDLRWFGYTRGTPRVPTTARDDDRPAQRETSPHLPQRW